MSPQVVGGAAWVALVVLLRVGLLGAAEEPAEKVDAANPAEKILVNLDKNFDLAAVEARDVKVALSAGEGGNSLRLALGHEIKWPGITLKAPAGRWDLSAFEYVAVDVRNVGSRSVRVGCRLDSPNPDGAPSSLQNSTDLQPEERKTLKVQLRKKLPESLAPRFFGMRGYPWGWAEKGGADTGNISQLLVYAVEPSTDHVLEVAKIRAGGSCPTPPTADQSRLFPLIDPYGQFIHKDWPGKTKAPEDFARRLKQEAADLAQRAGPGGWNKYGGWQAGPQLEATGFFRAQKYQDQWWLVDPEGRLFWSHGIDCVRPENGATPITDRESWFQDLPQEDSPFARFYGTGRGAAHGYYSGKAYRTYNFTAANLFRKYGPDWKQHFAAVSQRRLRSWGMNTIGNWSDDEVYLLRKTPYVVAVWAGSKPLEGSSGYWGKFADVFDPSFREGLRKRMLREKGASAGDPCCLGYFVDNELSWGDELSLAVATLTSPPDQPAKQVFVDDLKRKYQTLQQLNQAWGTAHASWDALLAGRTAPDKKKAYDDLAAFDTKTAEQYFRTCREAVKEAAPQNLYLGCRFAWANDRAIRAAAKYCDLVSFNRYQDTIDGLRLPEGVDKPVVIGEFHFGALDRGMFHTGLRPVDNQIQRGKAYLRYVRGALGNPWIVGTHWFQYGDQATTGRSDGENYQIGFLDVCDTPYPETIQAGREIGDSLYTYRLGRQPGKAR